MNDDDFDLIKYSDVTLALSRKHQAYQESRRIAKEICNRILTLRPYILRGAQFMYDNEKMFGFASEVRIALWDEKFWHDKLTEVWDGEPQTWKEAYKKVKDPLSAYSLVLSFPRIRGQDQFETPGKVRVITPYLYSDYEWTSGFTGIAFVDLDDFECGT